MTNSMITVFNNSFRYIGFVIFQLCVLILSFGLFHSIVLKSALTSIQSHFQAAFKMTLFFDYSQWESFMEEASGGHIFLAVLQLFWIHFIVLSIFFAIQFEIVRIAMTYKKDLSKASGVLK